MATIVAAVSLSGWLALMIGNYRGLRISRQKTWTMIVGWAAIISVVTVFFGISGLRSALGLTFI